MSNINRILSFIIGLIILVILLLFINSRINKSNIAQSNGSNITITQSAEKKGFDFFGLFKKKPTPTSIANPTPDTGRYDPDFGQGGGFGPTEESRQDNNNDGGTSGNIGETKGDSSLTPTVFVDQKGDLTEIPRTGAPTLLIPLALSALFGGTYLRKKS